MSTATLNLVVVPKRMLSRLEAAHHCGRPAKRFDSECPCNPVIFPNGDRRWDLRDLDIWLDGMKDGFLDTEQIIGRLAA